MKYIMDLRAGIESLIKENNAYFIGEDIQEPYGGAFKVTKGLSEKYPSNIIGVPMCEQGFTGLGLGMAMYGCYVSVEIMFGDFITLATDQMINHAAKFSELYNEEIHMVLRCPSGGYRGYGATHSQSLEKMYMGIPGIQVVAPSIACDPGSLLAKAMKSGIPTLFVENKSDYPRELLGDKGKFWERTVIETVASYPVARISPIGEKPDITIITYGGMVELALSAMEHLLYEDEINVEILAASLLTDVSPLIELTGTKSVIILEEGVEDFGWGSEVSCLVGEKKKRYARRIGAKNHIISSAKNAEAFVLPDLERIICAVREEVAV